MQYIWIFMMVLSISLLVFSSPDLILSSMSASMQSSLTLCISLISVYCLWMGLINILKDCELISSLSRKLRPLLKKMFNTADDEICDDLSLNISANLLGVGNAATPPAISAIRKMDDRKGKMTKGMAMLFVLNASGLQLIPTTIIGLRASLGSVNPSDIILPSLITSLIATLVGIVLVMVAYRKRTK